MSVASFSGIPRRSQTAATDHCGFNTRTRSTGLPLARLNPRAENVFQSGGGAGKVLERDAVGTITKRGPDRSMNSAALFFVICVMKPWTRDRKYQTRLGSWYSIAPNSISGRRSPRACSNKADPGKNEARNGGGKNGREH